MLTSKFVSIWTCFEFSFYVPAPDERNYTHWKQTVFYVDAGDNEYLTVKRNEELTGVLTISPNKSNSVSRHNYMYRMFQINREGFLSSQK